MGWWEDLEHALRTLAGLPAPVDPPDPARLAESLEASRTRRLDEPGPVSRLAFAPDGSALALGLSAGAVRILPQGAGVEARRFAGLGGGVAGLAFVPQDPTLVLAAAGDGEVRLLTTELPTQLWSTRVPGGAALAGAPNGRALAVACTDGKVRILSLASGRQESVGPVSEQPLGPLAFAPGGTVLAVGDRAGRIWLGDPFDPDEFVPVEAHAGAVLDLAFAEDGVLVHSIGADRTLAVTHVDEARRLAGFSLGAAAPGAIALVPASDLALVGSSDGRLSLFELVQGRSLARVDAGVGAVAAVATTRDGRTVACAGATGAWLAGGLPAPARG